MEADHIYPLSKGGETTLANLITACRSCNNGKRAKTRINHISADVSDKLKELKVRRQQLKLYAKYLEDLQANNPLVDLACKEFQQWTNKTPTPKYRTHFASMMNKYPPELVVKAIRISARKESLQSCEDFLKYTWGVLRNLLVEDVKSTFFPVDNFASKSQIPNKH